MSQKAEHDFQSEYRSNYSGSSDQSIWIWGGLAALVVLGLVIWLATSVTTPQGQIGSGVPTTEQITPAPAPPAPVQPVQPPANP